MRSIASFGVFEGGDGDARDVGVQLIWRETMVILLISLR